MIELEAVWALLTAPFPMYLMAVISVVTILDSLK